MTTSETLAKVREPFPSNQINKLPKPFKKDSPRSNCRECGGFHGLPAVHLDYVGHAALTDRLLDVDPEWSWEPLGVDENGLPAFDKIGGLWIRLTVCGVSRLGYGHPDGKSGGNAIKEAIGDALRNAGMRFGAALDLWHKGELHEASEALGSADVSEGNSVASAAKPAASNAPSVTQTSLLDQIKSAMKLRNVSKADVDSHVAAKHGFGSLSEALGNERVLLAVLGWVEEQ